MDMCIKVLQRNRTNRIDIHLDSSIDREIDREIERFIVGIGSCGYKSQEVPRSAICKMENLERLE